MAEELRAQVRERFRASCAYCGVHEDAVGATLTVDHYRPRAHGGADEKENLVYCCARCNEHKGAYWHEHDPPHVRLLHPGQDDLTQYLHESDDGRIVGLAPEGEFFIQRLRLNRPQLVAYRRARQIVAVGDHRNRGGEATPFDGVALGSSASCRPCTVSHTEIVDRPVLKSTETKIRSGGVFSRIGPDV